LCVHQWRNYTEAEGVSTGLLEAASEGAASQRIVCVMYMRNKKAVLPQGKTRDAAENFDT